MQTSIHPVHTNTQAARNLLNTSTPECPSGMYEFEWDGDLAEPITCHLSYDPAERGFREYGSGLQLEPDFDECMTLEAAYIRGLEMSLILSPSQIALIESMALVDLHETRRNDFDEFDGYDD